MNYFLIGATSVVAGTAGVSGFTNSAGTSAVFSTPTDVALNSAGYLFIADSMNYVIRKILVSSGTYL